MKHLTLTLIFLSACGVAPPEIPTPEPESTACSHYAFLGTWQSNIDTLTLNNNCKGTSQFCQAKFTAKDKIVAGVLTVTIQETITHPWCLPVGVHDCAINHSEPTLTLDCGGGATIYSRQ